jgi:hypothetical protein
MGAAHEIDQPDTVPLRPSEMGFLLERSIVRLVSRPQQMARPRVQFTLVFRTARIVFPNHSLLSLLAVTQTLSRRRP